MTRALFSVLALAAAATVSSADVITQSFSYSWDSSQVQHPFAFQAFDSMGGTRELTAVRLGFEGTVSMEITAFTRDPEPVHSGEWSVEASHTVVAYFNGGGIDLLQGIGGQSMSDITGELGGGINGEPGTPLIVTDTVPLANTVELDPSVVPQFYGSGEFTGFMDGFFDAVVTPPSGGQWIEVSASLLSQQGTVTLTYEYATVPAPGVAAVLGMGLALVARRRR